MTWYKDQVRIKIWSSDEEARETLLNELEKEGFTASDNETAAGSIKNSEAIIQYGGAEKEAIKTIAGITCRLFGQPKSKIETNEIWSDADRDVYIRIPAGWKIKLGRVKKILYFDPEHGCHFSKSEEEFEERKRQLKEKGLKIRLGCIHNKKT